MRYTTFAAASLLAVGCRTVSTDVHQRPASTVNEQTRASAAAPAAAVASAPAPPAEAPEAPLAWGTRPAKDGPLHPVVDGMCVHGEIWPLGRGALYTYGNGTGSWSRGGRATIARFVDDGLELGAETYAKPDAEAREQLAPMGVAGTWPAPLLLYSSDQGNGRMRDYPSIWSHDSAGWHLLASHRENGMPGYTAPVLFGGNAVAARQEYTPTADWIATTIKSWPLDAAARPVAGLASLARPGLDVFRLVANDTAIFAIGSSKDADAYRPTLRWLEDGKVTEVPLPEGQVRVLGTRPDLVLAVDGARIFRLEGKKLLPTPLKLPSGATIASGALAPNGDVWLLTTKKQVLVVRRASPPSTADVVEETVLPAPSSPRPREAVQHWPTSGALLAGVEVGDPYAVGDGGALFHFDAGTWREVPLPTPPFATSGRYQAQAVLVPAKGDVYVNAGYAEKGIGWTTPERYRAVLRNKRPREVLRCNEPMANWGSGIGFMSFPPIADDSCDTPFVILLRVGYYLTSKEPAHPFDRKTDYPSVRSTIKELPALGKEVELVELVAGEQRYLGARVPSVAAGRELARAYGRKTVGPVETRPEVVCGRPKEERTIRVEVATGKVVTPLRGE